MKNIRDYVCPNCKKNLKICKKKNNCYFAILKNNIPCFTKRKTSKVTNYEISQANKFYNNYTYINHSISLKYCKTPIINSIPYMFVSF